MKALFHRLNKGLGRESKEPKVEVRDPPLTSKEKLPVQLPKLPEWPPRPQSVAQSLKPLPEIVQQPVEEPEQPTRSPSPVLAPATTPPQPPQPEATPMNRIGARKLANASSSTNASTTVNGGSQDGHNKKVAFISPSPTPANFDRVLPDPPPAVVSSSGGVKSTVSRFQAQHGKEPRGSTSSSSSTKSPPDSGRVSVKSTRTAVSPSHHNAASSQSLRSGTPYSQMSNASSRILSPASWSEGAEEDLVSNLGPRERTRQEVLWEIVASEERYVGELIKMRDTFTEPLLHPFSSPALDYEDLPRSESPSASGDQLPIAARFMTPTGSGSDTPTSPGPSMLRHPNIDGESLQTDEDEQEDGDRVGKGYPTAANTSQAAKHNHPRSPYRSTATRNTGRTPTVPFPSRSHQSLPPPPRGGVPASGSTHSLGRQSVLIEQQQQRDRKYSQDQASAAPTQGSRVLRKFKKSTTGSDSLVNGAVAPHQLPEDLRICLEVVESGILDGHVRLSDGLRKRYDEQYPLVRSLADVFVSNSHIFHGYATYVLHLERALQQVDDALKNVNKKSKKQDEAEWLKVCKYLQQLEQIAANKGETGLAISLSKPFQRLLKYPLLFQNLLFHTDPSTFEYESTLQMVAEVETIVRSIEDEKIQKEERDKTRDVFARIEGLEKVRQLALPKPSRVLMDERVILEGVNANGSPKTAAAPPHVASPKGSAAVKGKSSLKRLSDVLHVNNGGVGGKKDLWLVVFNDVVLRCQRTGTTSLPLVAATNSRTNSMPELAGKAKYATTGRRNLQTRPRNMYKFLKIEEWSIGDVIQPREGVVSMDDVVRSRSQIHSNQPRIVPMPDDKEDEDGGMDSDDSDRKSKMSFSYWGADKVTIQKPAIKARTPGTSSNPPRRGGATPSPSYGRESSANAKFGSRLVSGEHNPSPHARPASRRTQQGTPLPRRAAAAASDDNSMRATITSNRPEWNSTRKMAAGTSTPEGAKRSRNTSLTNARSTTTPKQLASPAPSEDSGVGLYRQIMANDSTLNASLKT